MDVPSTTSTKNGNSKMKSFHKLFTQFYLLEPRYLPCCKQNSTAKRQFQSLKYWSIESDVDIKYFLEVGYDTTKINS